MKEKHLKSFALFFSVLLFFQESNALLREQLINNARLEKNVYSEDEFTGVELPRSRKKRWAGAVVVAITAASSALDIYKQVDNCGSKIRDLSKELKNLQKKFLDLKDQANLAWLPAESREGYTNRLNSNLVIIRLQISKFDSLQSDLVKLLDQDLIDKLRNVTKKLENRIDRNNETEIASFEDLEGKYMDSTTFALTLTAKLLPAGFLLGAKFLLPKITARFAKAVGDAWANQNPTRVDKMLKSFADKKGRFSKWKAAKTDAFKVTLKAKFGKVQAKFPRITKALGRLKDSKIGKALGKNMGKIKSAAKHIGQGLFVAFTAGMVIFDAFMYAKECEGREKKALEAIANVKNNTKNVKILLEDVAAMKKDADEYYNLMKSNITNDDFLNVLSEIAELGENAQQQNPEIVSATNQIKQYINEIKAANDKKTDQLNTMLVSAFNKINFKLECLRVKLAIIRGVIDDCEIGLGDFDKIYSKASGKGEKIPKDCTKGHYMKKDEIKGIMFAAMELKKKQNMCIRNNPTKKQLICEKWYNDVSDKDIQKDYSDLTMADITYFIKSCPPANVNNNLREFICSKKNSDQVTLNSVQQKYHKYDQAKIKLAYEQCMLSTSSVEVICKDKMDGYPISYVQGKFLVFPSKMVEKEFNDCKKSTEIAPDVKEMICNLKYFGQKFDSAIFQLYKKKYDEAALKDTYDQCKSRKIAL